MHKSTNKKMQRYNAGNVDFGFSYPPHLKNEYDRDYQYKCTQQEFYSLVKKEIQECKVAETEKKADYTLWFGKYKGEKLFEIEDGYYLNWLCESYRKKNKVLVGQALLRMNEIFYGNI